MLRLQLVVLEHVRRGDRHFDLLIEPPTPGRERLWAARWHGPWPPVRGVAAALTPLPPHRRRYLRFQGDLGGGRGVVRRIDAGEATAALWARGRIELAVASRRWCGRLRVRRLASTWIATGVEETGGEIRAAEPGRGGAARGTDIEV